MAVSHPIPAAHPPEPFHLASRHLSGCKSTNIIILILSIFHNFKTLLLPQSHSSQQSSYRISIKPAFYKSREWGSEPSKDLSAQKGEWKLRSSKRSWDVIFPSNFPFLMTLMRVWYIPAIDKNRRNLPLLSSTPQPAPVSKSEYRKCMI